MANKEKSCCSRNPPSSAPSQWHRYLPLITLIALTILAATAKQIHYESWEMQSAMHDFMGLFLLVFSMLKLFNLKGFAESFRKYDLLATKLPIYGLLYPFLELFLALSYLSHWQPRLTYTLTILLMTFGALGVFQSLRKKLELNCACMGSSLNVPLSTVAVIEDIGMAVMALMMLLLG